MKMSYINLTAGILKEELENIPDEYIIKIKCSNGSVNDAMDFEINNEFMEFVIV